MKLSQTDMQTCLQLNDKQITELVFGDCRDSGESADVALLLGTRPEGCAERAEEAGQLYLEGRVRYIVASGGVEWEWNGGTVNEARFMEQILLSMGVPKEAILLDEEATTTKENMICGAFQINRHLKLQNARRVCIVTSPSHLRRSLALAKLLLPRSMHITGCPARNARVTGENWMQTEEGRKSVLTNGYLLKGLVDQGLIDEIEFS